MFMCTQLTFFDWEVASQVQVPRSLVFRLKVNQHNVTGGLWCP